MEAIITPTYTVYFEKAAYRALNDHLAGSAYSRVFILVDENTRVHCLSPFTAHLPEGLRYEVISIPAGELYKNIDSCTTVWQTLSDRDADRKSLLINLGGGVVTDLGGFVASCFKRGIAFINVPTTLLAMVDASIGGKTGVDLGMLKNQIGVINQPLMVLVDPSYLQTLDQRQLQSGFAEMLKHGLICDAGYWEALKIRNNFKNIGHHIYESVQIKNKVVIQDPQENNLRKTLNYGHTLGHAIESYFLEKKGKEALLHGEAIAIGMILEAYLSYKLTGLELSQLEDIKATFLSRYKKVRFSPEDIEGILSLLKFDKKNTHGQINFVLLKAIGNTIIDKQVPPNLHAEAFAYYMD